METGVFSIWYVPRGYLEDIWGYPVSAKRVTFSENCSERSVLLRRGVNAGT
jgi:hypothetical protein